MSLNNPNEIQIFDNSKTKQLITRIVILELLIDIALVILIALCAYHASAYESETGNFSEGESYAVMWGIDYAYDSSIENPSWYQPIKDYLVKLEGYFKENPPEIDMSIYVKKEIWKQDHYEDDLTHTWTMSKPFYYFSGNGTEIPQSNLDPIKEYFKNNTEDINDFTPVGQGDHPDILNVSIDINSDGDALDRSAQGYIAMTQDDLTDMKSTIGGQDYGFSLSGMGGEGGIGEVYASVGTGGERSGGMSDIFKYLFYALIPILFILSIINMISKVI